ncbi:MAG: nitrous oxide reductase accessory protein NosL [Bacteroidetes bacterium]|nr:nitrous oxide reductase accessory protein NosL [Bacteroidota bacterium]
MRSIALVLFALFLTACSKPSPQPLRYGHDQCAQCKMEIEDQKFGAEAVANTGKVMVFDSPECLAQWVLARPGGMDGIHSLWVTDFIRPGTLIDASQAFFLYSPMIKSPMGLNYAAFATDEERHRAQISFTGEDRTWNDAMRDAGSLH